MEILKKAVTFVAATMAAGLLIAWSLHAFGFRSPVVAFIVNWMVMACVATLFLVVRVSLPSTYYEARPFERSGRVYECIGIRLVKKFLRRGPLRILSPRLRLPKEKTVVTLRNLQNEMRKAETAHVLTLVLMLLLIGYSAVKGWLDAALWLLLFDLLLNVYPIMLQRYNRIKLDDLIRKQDG